MMMQKIGTLLFCLLTTLAWAGDEYAVAKISPELLKGANAVKRMEIQRFEIKDPGKAVYYYKYAITILNEAGDEHAEWVEPYDKFSSIKSVDGTLFDANGKKIKSIKKGEIIDISATSDISLAEDNRIKHHNFNYKIYPYTVEYEVEIKQEGLLFMPSWMPLQDEDYAVEQSLYEVICDADYSIRYKAYKYDSEPSITNSGKTKTYKWEVKALTAKKREYAAPEWQKITPTVVVGPTQFSIEGYTGNMNTWQDFGKFVQALKSDKDILPEHIKTAIHQIADPEKDVKKKVALLYNYMQQNTRYISIQLGIGGWQPFDATYVATKRYGDCKALTNYMYAILKEVGIKSNYSLIKAGEYRRYIVEDFPGQQFNHAILSVPLDKDTVWLECTSQTLPSGYLSSFTSNRYALAINEEGGFLVRTPRYTANDNLQTRTINATLDENGKLSAAITTVYHGEQQDDLHQIINGYTKKEQEERLKKNINLPTYDIKSFGYKEIKNKIPAIEETLQLEADNYAQITGKRLFIQPNILSKSGLKLPTEPRQHDIDLMFEYRDEDTVSITIPTGYKPEALPQPISINNKFGIYSIQYKIEADKIICIRVNEAIAGKHPAADYMALVKHYDDIFKADRGRIVLVKNE
jgi:transglutaminase-like putative cysteine protease